MSSHHHHHHPPPPPSGGGPPATEESEEELEQKALGKIVFAMRKYAACMEQEIQRWEHNYAALSARHRALLHHLPAKAAAARRAVKQNQLFIKALLYNFAGADDPEPDPAAAEASGGGGRADPHSGVGPDDLNAGALRAADEMEAAGVQCPPGDAEKVRYVLKNLVRDWAAEGALERQQSYTRIIEELKARFVHWQGPRPPRVLLPGAGLGRLCVEVAAAGFEAQGNEFSYFMLLTAAFMLNCTACAEQWTIHPWVHLTCNNVTDADQLRGVSVPDVVPSSLVEPGMLSMCAGDFSEVYARPEFQGSFDAVVTCFFIDTAHNILDYLEVIHGVLRPGGIWIHLGPLLWHWAEGSWDELSIELSLADVQQISQLMGFDLLQQQFVDAAYIANLRSMYRTVYQAAFWTMRKTDRQLPTDLSELVQLLALNKAQQQRQQQQQQQPPSQQQQPGKQQKTEPNEEEQQQQPEQQSSEQQGRQQQEQRTHSTTHHQECCLQAEGCVQLAVQPDSLQQGEQQVATQQPGLCFSSALQSQSCQHTMQRPKVF